jgi:hypothetical protein
MLAEGMEKPTTNPAKSLKVERESIDGNVHLSEAPGRRGVDGGYHERDVRLKGWPLLNPDEGVAKHPGPADFAGNALDRRALRPIEQGHPLNSLRLSVYEIRASVVTPTLIQAQSKLVPTLDRLCSGSDDLLC